MIRRLLETLIIELFEAKKIPQKIKNKDGDYFFLRDLIRTTLAEDSWSLGKNTKKALPKLKDIGDKSAHSRRYLAQRLDIFNIQPDLRTVLQEVILLAELKKDD